MTDDCLRSTLDTEARAPRSTYRLQMHKAFTFEDAQALVPYLKQLGIGDAYASPIFEARPGSMHGYDVTRHDRLNPELGGEQAFHHFAATLKEHGLGLLLDIVPNHMGVGNDSVWWQDVLENGRASVYANYFDIDWTPLKAAMQSKLLLPILGKQYGEALEAKEIQLTIDEVEGGALPRIAYFTHSMPVAPRTIPYLFPAERNDEFGVSAEFRALLDELAAIPPHDTVDADLVAKRRAVLEDLRPRLIQAFAQADNRAAFDQAATAINGTEGIAASFDNLHALLEVQPYRLAYWKTSSEQINYRRFFDVNDLVGLRMENPEVFAATHCLIRQLLASGEVSGLRIDHCDGMFNPREYLERLQTLFVAAKCAGPVAGADATSAGIEKSIADAVGGHEWGSAKCPLYCVVEKILEPGEVLPRDWAVQGTSGYDFVHFANQIFIQPENQERFDRIYAEFIGGAIHPEEIIYQSKLKVMETSLSSETHVLRNLLSSIAGAERRARDFTDTLLETAIRETIACFPVYRTYIDERGVYSEGDRKVILDATAEARRRNPGVDGSAFDFLERVLLLDGRGARSNEVLDDAVLYFALKFQQLTGPVMAKGVEDTSFYVYLRFISSNEVGSAMEAFGITPELLHKANAERLKHTPHAMLTTSTHDTKRSEDVRSRLNILSEMPGEWARQLKRWRRMNAKYKQTFTGGKVAPDANEEYLIYQTILGAWPWVSGPAGDAAFARKEFTDRITQYLQKALSEAKVNVSWVNPNPEWIEAVQKFVTAILIPKAPAPTDVAAKSASKPAPETPFVEELLRFIKPLELFGAVNSLAQLVLKATSPGVPDFYQGTELWDLSLVDPDNRRPVDYKLRAEYLTQVAELAKNDGPKSVVKTILASLSDGRTKLWTMQRVLELRNRLGSTFTDSAYTPIALKESDHAIAYLRGEGVLVVLPRFPYTLMHGEAKLPLGDVWGKRQFTLPSGAASRWTNIFTGEEVQAEGSNLRLSEVFKHFPVAVLTSDSPA
jgi:(1->4)-alpha-D-glucan 1-alpha-D-glucosylmutase